MSTKPSRSSWLRLAAWFLLGLAGPLHAVSDADILKAWQERHVFVTGQTWQFPAWPNGTAAPVMPGDDYAAVRTDSAIQGIYDYVINSGGDMAPFFTRLPDFYLTTSDIEGKDAPSLADVRVSRIYRNGLTPADNTPTGRREFIASLVLDMSTAIRPLTMHDTVRRAWYDSDFGTGEIAGANQTVDWENPALFRSSASGFNETAPPSPPPQSNVWFVNGRLDAWSNPAAAAAPHVASAGEWKLFVRPATLVGGSFRTWLENNFGAVNRLRRLKNADIRWPEPLPNSDPDRVVAYPSFTDFSASLGRLLDPDSQPFLPAGSNVNGVTNSTPILYLEYALGVARPAFRFLPGAGYYDTEQAVGVVRRRNCGDCPPGTLETGEVPSLSVTVGYPSPGGLLQQVILDIGGGSPSASFEVSPDKLKLPPEGNGTSVINRPPGTSTETEVITPEAVTHIISPDPRVIQLITWPRGATGSPQADGWRQPPIGVQPQAVNIIRQPNPGTIDGLSVENIRGGISETTTWNWLPATAQWRRTSTRGESDFALVITPAQDARNTVTIARSPAGQVTSHIERSSILTTRGWQDVLEVSDPAGATLVTRRDFYLKPDGPARSGLLKSVIRPDGSFTRYFYDTLGRTVREESSWLDAAVEDANAQLKVTDRVHYLSNPAAPGQSFTYNPGGPTAWPGKASEARETITGIPTARSARIEWRETQGGSVIDCTAEINATELAADPDQQFRAAGGSYKTLATLRAEGNLVTVTKTFSGGPFNGLPLSVQKPDGTYVLTSYATVPAGIAADDADQLETTVETGAADASGLTIIDGTRTVSLANRQRRLIAETVTDIASGKTLSSKTAASTDDFGRVLVWQYNDGTAETIAYGCCGPATSTDRTGLTTNYPQQDIAVNGGTESSSAVPIRWTGADAQPQDGWLTQRTRIEGRTVIRSRIGADGSVIETERTVSDSAERVLSKTDAMLRTTTFSETQAPVGLAPAAGDPDNRPKHLIRTTTNPDGGTIIEESAADGRLLRRTGTAVFPERREYGLSSPSAGYPALPFTRTIRLRPDLTDSGESSTAWTDPAGRALVTITSAGAATWTRYDAAGRISGSVDPDGVATLYGYDAQSRRVITAIDMDRDGTIGFGGTDRITRTLTAVVSDPVRGDVLRTTTEVWTTPGADTPATLETKDVSFDGRRQWLEKDGTVTQTITTLQGTGNTIESTTLPDQTSVLVTSSGGRTILTETRNAVGSAVLSSSMQYDAHGRIRAAVDGRRGPTESTYYADDRIHTETTPPPGDLAGNGPQTTVYTYDAAGRMDTVTLPGHTAAAPWLADHDYFPTGLKSLVRGPGRARTEYSWDHAGRPLTETHFQNTGSGQTESWLYDPQSGFLMQKLGADGKGPTFVLSPAGRPVSRTWARLNGGQPVVTTWSRDNAGDVSDITYSDATPAVHYSRSRHGLVQSMTDAAGRRTFSLNAAGRVLSESVAAVSGSPSHLAGAVFTPGYDSADRRISWSAALGQASIGFGFGYDSSGRPGWVEQGALRATLQRLPLSDLVSGISWTVGGASRLTEARAYDLLDRVKSVQTSGNAGFASSVNYVLDGRGDRIALNESGGGAWAFARDGDGNLIAASRTQGGIPVPGQQYAWQFDDAGNRLTSSRGDSPEPASHEELSTYSVNALNRYTSRTHPGSLNVSGTAHTAAEISVNGQGTVRVELPVEGGIPAESLFHARVAVDNEGPAPVTVDAQISATELTATETETRRTLLPPAAESFTYDDDGNLIRDALYDYSWDAENRLIRVQSRSNWPAGSQSVPLQRLEFAYDSEGRRIRKSAWLGNADAGAPGGVAWILSHDRRCLFDGSRICAEIDPDGTVFRSHLWSPLPSGGLLAVTARSAAPADGSALPPPSTLLAVSDGENSITALIAADSHLPGTTAGSPAARFQYDPSGELLSASGPAATLNEVGFRSRLRDAETGLLYDGVRYYDPADGVSLGAGE